MKKKLIALFAGAALMATAGIASADGTLALYGSSAQAKFWAAQASTWMTNSLGCGNVVSATSISGSGSYAGTTHYKVTGSGCTNGDAQGVAGTGVLTVLYTANDSVTGIQSVKGSVNADGCPSANQRVMYPSSGTTLSTASCQTVHMGISDVDASAIVQKTSGLKIGPLDTTGVTFAPDYSGDTQASQAAVATIYPTSGLTDVDPIDTLATPFAFWANKGVTATQCTAGLVGNYCGTPTAGSNQPTANAQCDTSSGAGNGVCGAAAPITNLTRLEATLLFSGQVPNWNYLGTYFTSQPAVICLRHAGSGTHATLDYAVMNHGLWGSSLLIKQASGSPTVWFNNASADEMNCINGDTSSNSGGGLTGAIGYSDADASPGTNVHELTYNGIYPTRTAMRNGLYDFYAIAHYYTNNSTDAAHNTLASDMVNWAIVPANMAPLKSNYWATVNEMVYYKTSDTAYPVYQGAANPIAP